MPIRKLLIANRGEIAVRIIRAAREMGIATVQVHSSADADMLAVEMADETLEIGPPPAAKSYLDQGAVLEAARRTGADAIHPGYGFLAENAQFADAVAEAGLIFVGPTGEMIRSMGDKATARKAAQDAGVPVVPGTSLITDMAEAATQAAEIGFPVMIKATAGGGGRGIRVAEDADSFARLAPQASAEAKSAFGDGGIYLEKMIKKARHIEVQVLGDGENFIHCFERECSLQRRRQKVWEEAPSPALDPKTRERLCAAAVDLARAVSYRGAGTVEFLYNDESEAFYFIEMNTRIQVEHPVTEIVTGIDLVREMIAIAFGTPLSIAQKDVTLSGHAIEVRINAEDPANGFAPFPGVVDGFRAPGGPGVRFDHMMYDGYQIPPFYDSLVGKLIVGAATRADAIARLVRAVSELRTGALKTTAPLFVALAQDPDVRRGTVHTKWLEPWLEENARRLKEGGAA